MSTAQRLDLRQSQSLVMTPQLQQAIKLLQYSNLELAAFVQEEAARNPLLEVETYQGESFDDGRAFADVASRLAEKLDTSSETLWNASGNTPHSDLQPWKSPKGSGFDGDEAGFDQTYSRAETLHEHLEAQIGLAFTSPQDRLVAAHLTDLLDESGYLRVDLKDESVALGCELSRLEEILSRLQSFDPSGVYARSLDECLKLQLIDRKEWSPAFAALLSNMEHLARGDFNRLMRLCQVTPGQLKTMIGQLKSLDPKPGLQFAQFRAETLIPDVVMVETGEGWRLELNPATLPKALLNKRYYVEINTQTKSKEDKAWVTGCWNSASWLVKALDQRAQTILKVSSAIIAHQDKFLNKGINYMKPLVLREIAEETGLHESTVSRVTTNKAIATPRGTFELKYFFSSTLGEGFSSHSSRSVQARIKALIEGEEPKKPLSDDQLTEILKKDGIDIARRTVAKYREAMRIPSSTERRRARTGRF